MEFSVAVFALIVAGAFLVGLLCGVIFIKSRDRRPMALYRETADKLAAAHAETASVTRARDSARSDLSRTTEELEAANQREAILGAQARTAVHELSNYRARFDDIIGMEAEVASLRAVASRVPGLERRIGELEPDIIDLRERRLVAD